MRELGILTARMIGLVGLLVGAFMSWDWYDHVRDRDIRPVLSQDEILANVSIGQAVKLSTLVKSPFISVRRVDFGDPVPKTDPDREAINRVLAGHGSLWGEKRDFDDFDWGSALIFVSADGVHVTHIKGSYLKSRSARWFKQFVDPRELPPHFGPADHFAASEARIALIEHKGRTYVSLGRLPPAAYSSSGRSGR